MDFPEREQRHHTDVFAGMMFYFLHDRKPGESVSFTDPDPVFQDSTAAWTVVGKERVEKFSGTYWRYLLLGPGPTLQWHEGHLGWIRRVADPVCEERETRAAWA